ncbi:uncharacterized protein N7484_010513 [Penicillium longicatenatum]|uniref:uncharacterized protein n=1 Tax=Penicillium longicatenatum TaxID=1561947 RepID=UPI002546C326|nr:uncharacterized protein N7484_010513 [Penicillium longicatenatum]KAJ5630413.1 hypothetical protein N7484_010513 [Penicillium longicatenatum]
MRHFTQIASLLLLWITLGTSAAVLGLSIPNTFRQSPLGLSQNQHFIMDKLIPGFTKPQPTGSETGPGADVPMICDVLPKTKGINIFAQLTRDFDPIASRLNDSSRNITVLAPRNSAVQALPRKPWEDPEDYAKFGDVNAYEGQDGQDRAKRNLERFVEAHLIPVNPWNEGEEVESLRGEKLKWTKEGDKIFIQPGNIEVDSIAEKVANGEVWVLNSVINYR